MNTVIMKYTLSTLLFAIVFLSFKSANSFKETIVPPYEVYVVDQKELPKATGIKGTSYTAELYVIDNTLKKVFGPYKGSSFPNSRQSKEDNEKPNTLQQGIHIFNNKFGHKGGTKRGLNLINKDEKRKTISFSWQMKPSEIVYANVHTGCSDNGNYNSRGSQGCITIHPKDVNSFFGHFDFSKGKKGNSEGILYIYRSSIEKRNSFIQQVKSIYKDDE